MDSIGFTFLLIELIGTAAFAITGVIKAIENELDVFGMIVLGFTTAVGGGILRDILIGQFPPQCFLNPIYAIIAFLTSIIIFLIAYRNQNKIIGGKELYVQIINVFDAIGLGIFVVVGINASINIVAFNNAFLSIFVGVITGIGGGMIRDIMAGQIPSVLRKKVYAMAAIIGGIVYYCLILVRAERSLSAFITISIVLALRLMATYFNWSLPKIKISD